MACYANMAACHLKREHWNKAIDCCGAVLALDPVNVKGFFRRGQGRMGLGEYEGAGADFKRAAELSPQDALIRQSLADARQRQQELDDRAQAELKHVYTRALASG
jgi:tetratricopeptide (TPR) repeat protein